MGKLEKNHDFLPGRHFKVFFLTFSGAPEHPLCPVQAMTSFLVSFLEISITFWPTGPICDTPCWCIITFISNESKEWLINWSLSIYWYKILSLFWPVLNCWCDLFQLWILLKLYYLVISRYFPLSTISWESKIKYTLAMRKEYWQTTDYHILPRIKNDGKSFIAIYCQFCWIEWSCRRNQWIKGMTN